MAFMKTKEITILWDVMESGLCGYRFGKISNHASAVTVKVTTRKYSMQKMLPSAIRRV